MTFTLQDYNELKKKYQDTKIAVLASHSLKPDEMQLLPAERREPMQFLEYIMEELDAQISAQGKEYAKHKKRPLSLLYQNEILNAAMHLMNVVITEGLSIRRLSYDSLTARRLLADIGITPIGVTPEKKPSDYQFFDMYRKLNLFLRLVYTNKDSRNGIDPEHRLRFIPVDTLAGYMRRGYALEEEFYNKSLAALGTSGAEVTDDSYRVTEPVPAPALAGLPKWDELNAKLHALELKEQGTKGATKVEEIGNTDRIAQLLFLKSIRASLASASLKEADKMAILAGAMYLVRGQINLKTYKVSPISNVDQSSVVHTGLTEILNAKAASPENVQDLVKATLLYLTHMSMDGLEFRSRTVFSDIPSFSLVEMLSLSRNMIKLCRGLALDGAVAGYKLALEAQAAIEKAKEAPTGLMGLLGRVGGLFHSISAPKDADKGAEKDADLTASDGVVVKEKDYEARVGATGPQ